MQKVNLELYNLETSIEYNINNAIQIDLAVQNTTFENSHLFVNDLIEKDLKTAIAVYEELKNQLPEDIDNYN